MRDIIWTLIIVWLVYRLVDVFRSIQAKRSASESRNFDHNPSGSSNTSAPKRDIKTAVQKHLNKEGEYVDFEEVK
jgi:hypothetical protein